MRPIFAAPLILVLAAAAGAQTKVSGKAECAKPDPNYSVEIGDRPGHVLELMKSACTWPTPLEIEGSPSKEGTDFDAVESAAHGRPIAVTTPRRSPAATNTPCGFRAPQR